MLEIHFDGETAFGRVTPKGVGHRTLISFGFHHEALELSGPEKVKIGIAIQEALLKSFPALCEKKS